MKRMILPALAALAVVSTADAYQIEPRLNAAPAASAAAPLLSRAGALGETPRDQRLQAGTPLTVDLRETEGSILRTQFTGLNSGAGAPFIRVFINNPDATEDTPRSDPSYAGAIAFFPVPLDGTFSSILNVSRLAPARSATYVLSGDGAARVTVESATLGTQ